MFSNCFQGPVFGASVAGRARSQDVHPMQTSRLWSRCLLKKFCSADVHRIVNGAEEVSNLESTQRIFDQAQKIALLGGRFLRFRVPGIELKNPSSPEIRKKIRRKSHEIPHPGSGPENTKKIQKKYENGPKMTVFVFFLYFFSYFRGPTRGGGFRDFFVFFSYFRA